MPHAFRSDSPNAHFLVGEMPAPHTLHTSWWEGTGVSVAVHALVLGIVVYGATHARQVVQTATTVTDRFRPIFFDSPSAGPGGGGGGGGDATSTQSRKAQLAPETPRALTATPNPIERAPKLDVQVPFATAQAIETLPGAITPMDPLAPGHGTGPGGGGGRGSGSGPDGDGPGVGSGRLGNFGGGARWPGNGVTSPKLIHEVKPQYTTDAVRAKLQGIIEMEAVVLPDGTVDPASIRVTRSVDSLFGLDQQAIKALKEWRFLPGTYKGQPVAVRINVELSFTLR